MLIVIRILFSDAAKRNELRITMSICDLTATPDALKSQMLIVIHVLFRDAAKRTELRITMSICDFTAAPDALKSQMPIVIRSLFRDAVKRNELRITKSISDLAAISNYFMIWRIKDGQRTRRASQGTAKRSQRHPKLPQETL